MEGPNIYELFLEYSRNPEKGTLTVPQVIVFIIVIHLGEEGSLNKKWDDESKKTAKIVALEEACEKVRQGIINAAPALFTIVMQVLKINLLMREEGRKGDIGGKKDFKLYDSIIELKKGV
mgnify:CR=1 FL=1